MTLHPHEVFRVLGVSSRLRILEMLKAEGPLPVKTMAERLGISEPAVSQHLKALRYAGLVTSERKGYWVPYSVDEKALEHCCGILIDLCACHGSGDANGCHAEEGKEDSLDALRARKKILQRQLDHIEVRLAELKEEVE